VGWPLKKTFLAKAQTYYFTLLGLKIVAPQAYVEALPCRARGIQNIKKKGLQRLFKLPACERRRNQTLLQQNPLKKILTKSSAP
jgi:hypothetical protein